MTRRTKVLSKKEDMVNGSLKLWCALTTTGIFEVYQKIYSKGEKHRKIKDARYGGF
jgi:hypothetical protein